MGICAPHPTVSTYLPHDISEIREKSQLLGKNPGKCVPQGQSLQAYKLILM